MSAQKSVPNRDNYNIYLIVSFSVLCGRSTVPFYDDPSTVVVFISYLWELISLFILLEADSSPPPSVVSVALT